MGLWRQRAPSEPCRTRASWRGLAAFGLSATAVFGCAGTPSGVAAPDNEELLVAAADVPTDPETLRADVGVSGVHVGSLESTWCPSTSPGGARIESEMTPAALLKVLLHSSGRAQTDWGQSDDTPRVSAYDVREGDVLRRYRVSYHRGSFDYVFERGGVAQLEGTDSVPEGAHAHDIQSALVVLRGWRPRLAARAHLYVVLGRRLWRVDVNFAGPQVIKVQGTPRLTTRVDGTARRLWEGPDSPGPRTFSIWFGEEPDRIPLLLNADGKYGPVTMTLTDRQTLPKTCGATPMPHAELR